MQILVLCGDYWHPQEVIRHGFAQLEDKGFLFDYIECCKDILTVDMISHYPVIFKC